MGQNIARAQPCENLGIGRGRFSDMGHDRQADTLCRLNRPVQRQQAEISGCVCPQPDLYANHQIAVFLYRRDAMIDRQQFTHGRFADNKIAVKRKYARIGNVDIGQQPKRRACKDEIPQPGKISGARTASIHHGHHTGAPGDGFRIDPIGGCLVIDVGMQINQAGNNQHAIRFNDCVGIAAG